MKAYEKIILKKSESMISHQVSIPLWDFSSNQGA